jgi:hypothetical protein
VTPREHYAEAERLLEVGRDVPNPAPEDVARAHVHALLATVPDPTVADARRALRDQTERQRAEVARSQPDAPPPRVRSTP